MNHRLALSYVLLCVVCMALGAATYRLVVVMGYAGHTYDPIVFTNSVSPYNELYRLRSDGDEWYAPWVDTTLINGILFQVRCQTLCL